MTTKKVNIDNIIKVCLIPQRHEYTLNNNDLWWSEKDINNFKTNYNTCIKVISCMKNVDFLEAKKILNSEDSI